MGTRGAVGFRVDGADKVAYNHFDSYPDGLGADVVEFIRDKFLSLGVEGMRKAAREIDRIDTDVPPTKDQQARFAPIADLGVSNRSLTDWYCLLRKLQGDLGAYVEHKAIPGGGEKFMLDSLFCEWAYVVNVDDMTLEVYKGFQEAPHDLGRYAALPGDGKYFPVALVAAFPLDDIPRNWIKQVEPDEEDEDAAE